MIYKCPDTIEEFDKQLEQLQFCKKELYNQAKSRIESGVAKSVSEASRQLAEETGRSAATIRDAIIREDKNKGVGLPHLSGTNKYQPVTPNLNNLELSHGGARIGAGRPSVSSEKLTQEKVEEVFESQPSLFEIEEIQLSIIPEPEIEIAVDLIDEHPEAATAIIIKHNHRAIGTGENEWYTPIEYIQAVKKVFSEIDLDPASSEQAQETVMAKSFFTINDNGLSKTWNGKIFLNPPYTQPDIKNFIQKAVDEYSSGNIQEAIILTHNYTDTSWFHSAASKCSAICFTRGRIGFLSPEGKKAAPTQGQAFFYFGDTPDKFVNVFADYGQIFTPKTPGY